MIMLDPKTAVELRRKGCVWGPFEYEGGRASKPCLMWSLEQLINGHSSAFQAMHHRRTRLNQVGA